jgi:hypothetical protein
MSALALPAGNSSVMTPKGIIKGPTTPNVITPVQPTTFEKSVPSNQPLITSQSQLPTNQPIKSVNTNPIAKSIPQAVKQSTIQSNRFGKIDLPKGEAKTLKSTGYGTDKIKAKGNITNKQIKSLIEKLPIKSETNNRIILEDENYRIILSKDWKGNATRPWLMNAFKKGDKGDVIKF